MVQIPYGVKPRRKKALKKLCGKNYTFYIRNIFLILLLGFAANNIFSDTYIYRLDTKFFLKYV